MDNHAAGREILKWLAPWSNQSSEAADSAPYSKTGVEWPTDIEAEEVAS